MGYPSLEEEKEILRRRRERQQEKVELLAVCSPQKLVEMQGYVEASKVKDDIEDYIVRIVDMTRRHSQVQVGSSPRGSLALMRLSSARSALYGRDYVLPDDVKAVAVPALAHRLILAADPWIRGVRPESVIESILKTVPVPKVD